MLSLTPETSIMREMLGNEVTFACVMEADAKRERIHALEDANAKLHTSWHTMREQLLAHHIPPEKLRAALTSAGLKTTPQELGWDETTWQTLARIARFTRGRLTFLELKV